MEKTRKKEKKKAKINHSILFFFPTIYLALLKVYTKFEDWLSQKPRILTEIFIGKKNG